MDEIASFRGVGRPLMDDELYFNNQEIETALLRFKNRYPVLCNLFPLPHTTFERRPNSALWIGHTPRNDHPTALFVANVHAREWLTADAVIAFTADLLEAYTSTNDISYDKNLYPYKTISSVLEQMNIIIVPVLNPDGRNYSQTVDQTWRKNRNFMTIEKEVEDKKTEKIILSGVDPNRNYPFLWDFKKYFAFENPPHCSDDPTDPQQFRGTGPASEAETRNVIWLLDTYPGIRWMIDIHNNSRWIMYPWSLDDAQIKREDMNFREDNPAWREQRGHIIHSDDPQSVLEKDDYREYMPKSDLGYFQALGQALQNGAQLNFVEPLYKLSPAARFDDPPMPYIGSSDDYGYSRHLSYGPGLPPQGPKVFSFTFECGPRKGEEFWPLRPTRSRVIKEASSALVAFLAKIIELGFERALNA